MPRRLNAASPLNVVALATLATFFIAGSQAQATNLFHGVSMNNGTPIAHLPPPPTRSPPVASMQYNPNWKKYVLPPNKTVGGWK
jgi:hypothetical protein